MSDQSSSGISTQSPESAVEVINIPTSSSSSDGNRSPYEPSDEPIPVRYFQVGDWAYLIKNSKATQTKCLNNSAEPGPSSFRPLGRVQGEPDIAVDTYNCKASQTYGYCGSTTNSTGSSEILSTNATINTDLAMEVQTESNEAPENIVGDMEPEASYVAVHNPHRKRRFVIGAAVLLVVAVILIASLLA